MEFLQIDSLSNSDHLQSFLDNFFWPLILALLSFFGWLLYRFLTKGKLKIEFQLDESYIVKENSTRYLVLKTKLINKSESAINNFTLSTQPSLKILKGIYTPIKPRRFETGGISLSGVVNWVENVILYEPIDLKPLSTLNGYIVLETFSHDKFQLRFDYLDKSIRKTIKVDGLREKILE